METGASNIAIGILLSAIILGSIIGNVLVVCAVKIDRRLHSPANFLICSLAVTDLLVSCLVMPFSALYQIFEKWILGSTFCRIWTATDMACCTASILHLCAIALERQQSITNAVHYYSERMRRTVAPKIFIVWLLAFCISIPPILGWKPSSNHQNFKELCLLDGQPANKTSNEPKYLCKVGHHPGYTVYATLGSFYIPLALLLVVYTKIYVLIHQHIKRSESRSRIISSSSEDRNSIKSTRRKFKKTDDNQPIPANPYLWKMGNIYHYNSSKFQDYFNKTRIRSCDIEKSGIPLMTVTLADDLDHSSDSSDGVGLVERNSRHIIHRTNEQPWNSLRAKDKRRLFVRRKISLSWDFDSESQSAPPFVQNTAYSRLPYEGPTISTLPIKKILVSSDFTSQSNSKGYKTKRKVRSESDLSMLAKHDPQLLDLKQRRRTKTEGHVHFADRGCIKSQNFNANGEALKVDVPQCKDNVFCDLSKSCQASQEKQIYCCFVCCVMDKHGSTTKVLNAQSQMPSSSPLLMHSVGLRAKIKVLKAREIRAIRTLGTIVGAFIICWLPFFVVTLTAPFCQCKMPTLLLNIVLWLGYCNSLINPILYAAFNRDFHAAFTKLLRKLRQL